MPKVSSFNKDFNSIHIAIKPKTLFGLGLTTKDYGVLTIIMMAVVVIFCLLVVINVIPI